MPSKTKRTCPSSKLVSDATEIDLSDNWTSCAMHCNILNNNSAGYMFSIYPFSGRALYLKSSDIILPEKGEALGDRSSA